MKFARAGTIAKTVGDFQYVLYVAGVIIPIGGRMEKAADFQCSFYLLNKWVLNQTSFVVALF